METITKIIDALISNIDFAYMLAVNVLTFLLIKIIDEVNGQKKVGKWLKRAVAAVAGLVIALPLIFIADAKIPVMLYSFILSFVSWDVIFKKIVKLLKLDYKK